MEWLRGWWTAAAMAWRHWLGLKRGGVTGARAMGFCCSRRGSPGGGQSQGVLQSAGDADTVVDDVEAADEHAVPEHAFVHVAAGEASGLGVEVAGHHDDLVGTEAARHVGLIGEAGHDGDVAVLLEGPYALEREEPLRALADDEHLVARLRRLAQHRPHRRAGGLDHEGVLVADVVRDGEEAAFGRDELLGPAAA